MYLNLHIINFVDKNNFIAKNYVCKNHNGLNLTPNLKWNNISNAKSYSIIFEDPNAVNGNFVHWYIPYISNNINELKSFQNKNIKNFNNINFSKLNLSKLNIFQGKNSLNKFGYFGPCAPKFTGIHGYIFKIYALDNIFPINNNNLQITSSFQFENLLKKYNINIITKEQHIFQYTFPIDL
jgi:Raf kinase inhibitor-like YbhB/YbcL family protein